MACVSVCSNSSIKSENGSLVFERRKCKQCGNCTKVCYAEARILKGRNYTVEEVITEIEKDMAFYRTSGGGVTLSGGEPLLQTDFALELLRQCKMRGLHTAMETCGFVTSKVIKQIAPLVDLFLYDIKHLDGNIHKEFTGVSNELILRNCELLIKLRKTVIVRVPVIPTFNADIKSLQQIVEFAREIGVKEIHLLPFHRFAAGKYRLMDRTYWNPGVNQIEKAVVEELVERVKVTDIVINIGG
jgi:pyruvate formate lyase activating enzyme